MMCFVRGKLFHGPIASPSNAKRKNAGDIDKKGLPRSESRKFVEKFMENFERIKKEPQKNSSNRHQ